MIYGTRKLNAPILSKINTIPCIDTRFHKIYFNIVSYVRLDLPKDFFL